jgi:hypothetical protein
MINTAMIKVCYRRLNHLAYGLTDLITIAVSKGQCDGREGDIYATVNQLRGDTDGS